MKHILYITAVAGIIMLAGTKSYTDPGPSPLPVEVPKQEFADAIDKFIKHQESQSPSTKASLSLYKTKPIELSPEEKILLARNIFFEAGIENYEGKIAVAQITFNRLQSGRWGEDLESVVYAPKQFSWTMSPEKRYKTPSGKLWNACMEAARDFRRGVRIKELDTATHYHAEYVKPKWAKHDAKLAQIGTHIFYSL